MGRKVRSGGSTSAFSFNKSKKYKYNSTGTLEEFTGEAGAEEITISGSKSSLRRMADMERNISILATKLTTTDGEADDGSNSSFGTNVNKTTRFKKGVRIDDTLDMKDTIDMNNHKITSLTTPTSGSDAANKTYVDAREAAAEATAEAYTDARESAITTAYQNYANQAEADAETAAAADATSKANAAQSAAISAAASDATSKANAAQAAAILAAASDATSKANTAKAEAISEVTNGAGAAFDTLKEIQDAMATDAELSTAINNITIGNGTVTVTGGSGLTGSGAFSMNQSNSETVTLNHADTSSQSSVNNSGRTYIQDITLDGFGHITAITSATETVVNTDTNTTYSAGSGVGLSGTSFSVAAGNGLSQTSTGLQMSGSYSGSFTATGDICAYSDASLKTNVQTIEGAMGKVDAIRGVTFDRLADGSTSTGVIAQELESVLPEAVQTDENGVKMVAYGNVTGLLIEALKELKAEVESLKK